jgi:hypothetical protein
MNLFFLPFTAGLLLIGTLQANPIAIDPSRRLVAMTAENVTITMQTGASLVQGHYTFELQKDDWPEDADTHVIIFIPVLLPANAGRQKHSSPRLKLGSRSFLGSIRHDLAPQGAPRSVEGMPKGWFLCNYEVIIPLHLLKQAFTVEVSYSQPHLPGNICGYVPMNPPKSPGASRIRFVAGTGVALKRQGWLWRLPWSSSAACLDFVPEDRRLICVRCVPQRPGY